MGNFNVNFLGRIPYNPDKLHRPRNYKNPRQMLNNRPVGLTPLDMFRLYWTVKSFEIDVTAFVMSTRDMFSDFVMAGGTSGGIAGAMAGLAVATANQARDPGIMRAKGHTKIIQKYDKKIRLGKEGVHGGITMPDSYKGDSGSALDMDESYDPNLLFGRNFKPNEGTICSAGPIHYFSSREQGSTNGSFFFLLDMGDIIFYKRMYWPAIFIQGNITPNAGNFNYGGLGLVDLNNLGVSLLPAFTSTAIGGFGGDLGYLTNFNTSLSFTQLMFVAGNIRIGKRCCDRFFWDGKDEVRESGGASPPASDPNSKPCEKVCKNDKKEGVFLNTPWPQQEAAKKKEKKD